MTAERAAPPDAAGLMDAIYKYQRHIYDITRKYYLLGRDTLIADLEPPPGGTVLEIGCGTGRNLITAAEKYPDAKFFGLDISRVMLETAQAKIDRAGLVDRIQLAQGDASSFDPQALFGVPRLDRVMFPYTLSMIPPWRDALAAGREVLAPGGVLLAVDFGDLAGLPAWFRVTLRWWLKQFHVTPRLELGAYLETLDPQVRQGPLFRGYAWYGRVFGPREPHAQAP